MCALCVDRYNRSVAANERPVNETLNAAYVTLLIGVPSSNKTAMNAMHRLGLGHVASRQEYLNRTVCFQRRLHALNSSYPLVVLHDFDANLSSHFDRAIRLPAPSVRKATLSQMHMNKLLVWTLTE